MTEPATSTTGFYERYFEYIGLTESPRIYHRWCAVSIIAALLGRNLYIPFGHDHIYPNHYILLVGDPGARKGTAITPSKKLLRQSGYTRFGPDRLSAERFIIELERASRPDIDGVDLDNPVELENITLDEVSELYVSLGEFGDFIGDGNINFIRLLTNLWDNLPEYKHPKIHGKSVAVPKPTVNILSGTTGQDISSTLPVEAIGQGYLSRIILVHGTGLGRLYSRLPEISEETINKFAKEIQEIRAVMHGELKISEEVWKLLDRIYKEFTDIDDYRFKHYSGRRYTHLLKLCLVFAAMCKNQELTPEMCIEANTLLHYTEMKMPRALGEFGKAKNSDTANSVMHIIRDAKEPIIMKDIYARVSQDLNKQSDLIDILNNLRTAGKIQVMDIPGTNRRGYAALNAVQKKWDDSLLNNSFLTIEERC